MSRASVIAPTMSAFDNGQHVGAPVHRVRKRLLALLVAVAVVSAPELPASAQVTVGTSEVSFDIPSQPLEDALMAYADATGVEVFVEHALTVGRRSQPVRGVYAFEAALRELLAGTGLEPHRAASHAYTLTRSADAPPAGWTPTWSTNRERSRFFGALQGAITQALCARPETKPGSYRVALALWIDATGTVASARVLGANSHMRSGHNLVGTLKGLAVKMPPPAGMPQPVTLVVLPRPVGQIGDCGAPRAERG